MSNKVFICLTFCLPLILLNWSKEERVFSKMTQRVQGSVSTKTEGAAPISGVGFYATTNECNAVQGFSYAVRMTGDLTGCLYTFIDDFECSPNGNYREEGREYFVGTYKGQSGTFWTEYKFESKYESCAANGAALGAEIFGRYQHTIVGGSGEGVFDGVTGRIDMKDNVDEGNFNYRGHLRF